MRLSVVFKHTCVWEVGRWQRRQRAVGWREGGDLFPLGDKKNEKGYSSGRKDDNADRNLCWDDRGL